ncbi:MAG: hypothetical protein ACI9R3_005697, partial [Verrucomicrobiales bacterium]
MGTPVVSSSQFIISLIERSLPVPRFAPVVSENSITAEVSYNQSLGFDKEPSVSTLPTFMLRVYPLTIRAGTGSQYTAHERDTPKRLRLSALAIVAQYRLESLVDDRA